MTIGTSSGNQYEDDAKYTVDYLDRTQSAQVQPLPIVPSPSIRPSIIPTERWITPTDPRYQHMPDRLPPGPIQPSQWGDKLSSDETPDEVKAGQQYAQAKEDPNNPLTAYEKVFLKVIDWMESSGAEAGTNIKLFNDVVQRGRIEPITEKDFRPIELEYMKGLVQYKFENTGEKKGAITYSDYVDYIKKVGGGERSLSMGSPSSVLRTSLGEFYYTTDDIGNITIEDKYDFNKAKGSEEGDKSIFNQIMGTLFGGTIMGGIVGRKLIPDTSGRGIPIKINLPKSGKQTMTDETPDEIKAGQHYASMQSPFQPQSLDTLITEYAGGSGARGSAPTVTSKASPSITLKHVEGRGLSGRTIPPELRAFTFEAAGKPGYVIVQPRTVYKFDEGSKNPRQVKDLYIQEMGTKGYTGYNLGSAGQWTLGPAVIRDVLRELKKEFPEAKTFTAQRVSGARRKHKDNTGEFGRTMITREFKE